MGLGAASMVPIFFVAASRLPGVAVAEAIARVARFARGHLVASVGRGIYSASVGAEAGINSGSRQSVHRPSPRPGVHS